MPAVIDKPVPSPPDLEPVVHGRQSADGIRYEERLQVLVPTGTLEAIREAARRAGYRRKRDMARYVRGIIRRDVEARGGAWPAAEPETPA